MSDDEPQDGGQASDLPEGWSSNANERFLITLARADGEPHASFQPEFTYPIFGEQEAIFGYKGLLIELNFAAHSLEPRLHISYDAIYRAQGDIKPTDIKAAITDFLPEEAFLDTQISYTDAASFIPPGERVRAYRRDGKQYEVRCASLADADAKRLLERMQILIPLFIEGGTMLQLEQDWTTKRWKLFTLWLVDAAEQGSSLYSLVGYGTSYRVFAALKIASKSAVYSGAEAEPDFLSPERSADDISSPLELPSRERLSQFLILPEFQGSGHGQELYRAIYKHLTTPNNIREFTVEDPNESFDDLRDFCDITYLRSQNPEFAGLEINTDMPAGSLGSDKTVPTDLIVSKELRDKIQTSEKMDKRQFDRLVEMHTLSKIPALHRSRNRITRREKTSNKHDKQYYFWRLYVKQRLLIFNRDALMQLEPQERVEKLEAAVDSNQEYIVNMIEKVTKKEARGISIDGDELAPTNGARSAKAAAKKRKVLDDDDDDEEDGQLATPTASKKPKVS
ncbi:hypothetical protein AMS68_005797 [Peltaster fructicola]|uniref:Histone acetyltransferase type B catalytic subunit n=1 Tax=Peltaster fructicola TaxID=286661 RepID=A0A6H0Y0U9_9PEZI|nr:hypothetical protein AMS68_005797 [Peltaster fructicola]